MGLRVLSLYGGLAVGAARPAFGATPNPTYRCRTPHFDLGRG